jgi:nicotinamidase-related amidase
MKILMVIDMQNDFISGSLGSKEAESIVDKVKAKIDEYKERGDIVVYTADTHSDDYLETPEGIKLPIPHCIKGTSGWEIDPRLGVSIESDFVIEKLTFGVSNMGDLLGEAFIAHVDKQLGKEIKDEDLEGVSLDSIEFVGLCTDVCVVSNALIARASLNVPVILDASCCAGTTVDKHKAAIEVMKSCQIEVINED